MKINKLQSGFAALCMGMALAFSACTDSVDREPSPVPTDGVQAYFNLDTPTSLQFLPEDEQGVDVTLERLTTEAGTLTLIGEGEGMTYPQEVAFAAGEKTKTIHVGFNLEIGTSGKYTLTIDDKNAFHYSLDAVTFSVSRDYTWVSAGTATYTDNMFFGIEGKIPVEQAKEKPELYRLPDLFVALNKDEGLPGTIQFTLDENNNAATILPIGELSPLNGGYMLYDPANYGEQYCFFQNEGNEFQIGYLWTDNQKDLYIGQGAFVWEGWPGEKATEE